MKKLLMASALLALTACTPSATDMKVLPKMEVLNVEPDGTILYCHYGFVYAKYTESIYPIFNMSAKPMYCRSWKANFGKLND